LHNTSASQTDKVVCQLREIGARDGEAVTQIAQLHMQLLSFGPAAALGEDFVREIGYAAPLKAGRLRLVVFEVDGRVAGYIALTTDARNFQTETIKENLFSVAWILMKLLILHPHRIGALLRAVRAASSHHKEADLIDSSCGEIAALAVHPDYCSAEFFRQTRFRPSEELIKYAAICLRRAGLRKMRTFVDADNRSVLMMHQRLGARFEDLLFGGVPTVRVWFDLQRQLLELPRTAVKEG
jgi:hypothetical protein